MKKRKKVPVPPPEPPRFGPDFRARSLPEWLAINAALGNLPSLRPFSDYSSQMTAAINARAFLDAYIAEMHACNGYSAMLRRMGMAPPETKTS